MARKKKLSDRVKLAAALLRLVKPRADGQGFEYRIPREQWPQLSVAEILAKYNFDHIVYEAIGGPSEPYNLDPIFVEEHQEKTPTDLRNIAKGKRLQKGVAAHAETMARKIGQAPEPGTEPGSAEASRGNARSRGFGRSQPMPGSRNTPYRRKFNGKTERRDAPQR